MDLILEGHLAPNSGIREVLQSVLKRASAATGILRISCPRRNLNGRLALFQGRFIVGAQITDSDESGYDAVKMLLSVRDGNFAFLETENAEALDMGKTLHISLDSLIERLPELPESSADLFDEQSLLDEVFGPGELDGTNTGGQSAVILPSEPDRSVDREPAWQVLTSLMQEEAPPVKAQGPILGYGARAERATVGGTAGHPDSTGVEKSRKVRLNAPLPIGATLGTVLILLIVLFIFVFNLTSSGGHRANVEEQSQHGAQRRAR